MNFQVIQVQGSDNTYNYPITLAKVSANNYMWMINRYKITDCTLGWYIGVDNQWHCVIGSTKRLQFTTREAAQQYLEDKLNAEKELASRDKV